MNSITAARDGRILGEFTRSEIDQCLRAKDGSLRLSDHILVEGQWVRLSTLIEGQQAITRRGIALILLPILLGALLWSLWGHWAQLWQLALEQLR